MTSASGGCAPQFFHIIAIQFVGVSLSLCAPLSGRQKHTNRRWGGRRATSSHSAFCHWAQSCKRLKSRSLVRARLFTPWLIRRTFVFERTHGIQSLCAKNIFSFAFAFKLKHTRTKRANEYYSLCSDILMPQKATFQMSTSW